MKLTHLCVAMLLGTVIGSAASARADEASNIVLIAGNLEKETAANEANFQNSVSENATGTGSDPALTKASNMTDAADAFAGQEAVVIGNASGASSGGNSGIIQNASSLTSTPGFLGLGDHVTSLVFNTANTYTRLGCNNVADVAPDAANQQGTLSPGSNHVDATPANYTNTPSNVTKIPNCLSTSVGYSVLSLVVGKVLDAKTQAAVFALQTSHKAENATHEDLPEF